MIFNDIVVVLIDVERVKKIGTIVQSSCNIGRFWQFFDTFQEIIVIIEMVKWKESVNTQSTEPVSIRQSTFEIIQQKPWAIMMYICFTWTTQYCYRMPLCSPFTYRTCIHDTLVIGSSIMNRTRDSELIKHKSGQCIKYVFDFISKVQNM